jgi:prevent-host-death family protein
MTKTLPISAVKTHLPELLDGVSEREDEIVVTRNGTPAAVILNFAEYERFKETLDVLSDPGLLRQIQRSRAFYAKGRHGLSFEEVFGESVRQRGKRRR